MLELCETLQLMKSFGRCKRIGVLNELQFFYATKLLFKTEMLTMTTEVETQVIPQNQS
jgi:hypothetical protein